MKKDMTDLEALKIIALENPNYDSEEINNRLYDLTGHCLAKGQMNLLWNTALGVVNLKKKSDLSETETETENLTPESEEDMIVENNLTDATNELKVNLSDTLRKILGKKDGFSLSIAEIKEKCFSQTGRTPSNPLIFQIKAKMKQGVEISKTVSNVVAVRNKNKPQKALPSKNIIELTNTLRKVKILVEEFNGKQNLIDFLAAL